MFACASTDLKIYKCTSDNTVLENDFIIYTLQEKFPIKSLSWCNNNKYLAFLADNEVPEILSVSNDNVKLVQKLKNFPNASAVTFRHCTKKYIGIGTKQGEVIEYDTISKSFDQKYFPLENQIDLLDYNCSDSCLAAASGSSLTLYSTTNETVYVTYNLPDSASVIQFDQNDEKILSTGTEDGEILLWDISVKRQIQQTHAHDGKINGLTKSNNNFLISVGDDCKICFYNLNSNQYVFRNFGLEPLTSISLNYDNVTLAVSSESGRIYFYDMRYYLQPKNVLKAHDGKIFKILFSNQSYETSNISEVNLQVPTTSVINLYNVDSGHFETKEDQLIDLKQEPKIIDSIDLKSNSDFFGSEKSDVTIDTLIGTSEIKNSVEENPLLQMEKLKSDVLEILTNYIDDATKQFDENLINISSYIKEQLKMLENCMDIFFVTILEKIYEKEFISNGYSKN